MPQLDVSVERMGLRDVQELASIAEQALDAAVDALHLAREKAGTKDLAVDDCYRLASRASDLVDRLRTERGWN